MSLETRSGLRVKSYYFLLFKVIDSLQILEATGVYYLNFPREGSQGKSFYLLRRYTSLE